MASGFHGNDVMFCGRLHFDLVFAVVQNVQVEVEVEVEV